MITEFTKPAESMLQAEIAVGTSGKHDALFQSQQSLVPEKKCQLKFLM